MKKSNVSSKTTIPAALIPVMLFCFGLLPEIQADPAPRAFAEPAAQLATQRGEDRGNGNSAAERVQALNAATTGANNTAHGWYSLFSNTTGGWNTADGYQALYSNTTGSSNTAEGVQALYSNIDGSGNTAHGYQALYSNTTGTDNTALGTVALESNVTGVENTAVGSAALAGNTASFNTAVGYIALQSNTTGESNSAMGWGALHANTTGTENTAVGVNALGASTATINNTGVGFHALYNNTTGNGNIALGVSAGSNHSTGDENIYIGNAGVDAEDGTIRIGDLVAAQTFIAGIRGVTTVNNDAIPVYIDSLDQLGTQSSSRRFKKDIQPMDHASEAILALKPVSFHYKSAKTNRPEFGLIAEEVAEVNPDLVVCDKNGEIYTVRYDAVNAMLLNEFLKEHKAFVKEKHKVEQLENTVAGLLASVKEQAAEIQKVSAQIEASKTMRQVASRD